MNYLQNQFGRVLLLLAALALPLCAQTITGSIVGTVVDPGGQAVSGAEVTFTAEATGLKRSVRTDERGDFLLGSLQPGEYSVSVVVTGFKSLTRRQIMLTASETLPLGKLALEVGAMAEEVTIRDPGVAVQTASSERAGVITSAQLDNLMIKGRNAMSLLSLMPGVVDNQGIGNQERIDRNFDIYVQGNRRNANSVTVDGMVVNPMGNNFNSVVVLSQDAIAEVKVLLSNYQAEYGRSSGAAVNFVTKSGGRDFHGLGSYFKRHEQFNANDFFNNRLNRPKPRYRYNTWNYNVGGPVYLPKDIFGPLGGFNENKEKLFFFWSQEYWPLKVPQPITQITTPTELERRGDFSQTLDVSNRLIPVIDPLTRAQFPGNIIPTNRIDRSGQALLNIFPTPNFFDRGISRGNYNYVYQTENETPIRMENLRVDYNLSQNHTFSFTLASFMDRQKGAVGILTSGSTNWPQLSKTYQLHGQGYIFRYSGVLSPTLINETSFGFTRRPEGNSADESEIARNQRATIGYAAAQFNPAANPLGLIPNATFGGVPAAANLFQEGRFPFAQRLNAFNLTNKITKTIATHTIKAGVIFERNYQGSNADGNYAGAINFGMDVNNPLDTRYAYSNALLGVFASYNEPSNRVNYHFRQHSVEWFAQDTWKATRRLTLDLGMRFQYLVPIYMSDDALSTFAPELYNPAQQMQLIRPARINGQRVGVHPVTGATYPATMIGAIAPGVGNPSNGLAVAGRDGYPRSLIKDYGVLYAPRFGFAWDVFGDAKTAVRGGFGLFYNRPNMSDNYIRFAGQSPLVSNPTVFYGTLSSLLSSAGAVFPQNVNALDRSDKVPSTMNFSLSIQRDIGFQTVVDIGYVGSLGRNLLWLRNLNPVPTGANFNPANADPTNPATPLPSSFLRPIQGYNDILMTEPAGSSSYHSLQVTARRRFSSNVTFGVAWTWSKAMGFSDFDTSGVSALTPVRVWNYGLATFDRTHILKIDWLWDLPKAPVGNRVLKTALHNWQLAGIASFISGSPLGVGLSTVTGIDFTGTASQGARVVVTGDPVLPKSERTFSRNFRTDVFQMPARGTFGNSAPVVLRGPGVNNWDLTLLKEFPIRDQMRFQFRAEVYNAFNHTQFSAVDTGARFDAQGNQVNARFGEFTATRSPRVMQLALRFYF
jgi:hypothetical protein